MEIVKAGGPAILVARHKVAQLLRKVFHLRKVIGIEEGQCAGIVIQQQVRLDDVVTRDRDELRPTELPLTFENTARYPIEAAGGLRVVGVNRQALGIGHWLCGPHTESGEE